MSAVNNKNLAASDMVVLGKYLQVDKEENRQWLSQLYDRFAEVWEQSPDLLHSSAYWLGVYHAFRYSRTMFDTYVMKNRHILDKFNNQDEARRILNTPTDEMIRRVFSLLQGFVYNAAEEVVNSD